ncbi:MAG: hypothetical protein Q8Q03_00145 [bacterium]|nr:hypothetical protein [bacterium]
MTKSIIRKYSYSGIRGDEDYNRYDDLIVEMVDYWNSEFAKDTDPPLELLDPSLVKAMMYQESRIGYFESAGVDVMQVGHPQDPALRTLQGGLKEYWIHNGEQLLLKYDTRVDTVKDSIKWGVRWLYHKAQGIQDDGHRYWRTWKEAVYEYGPHTSKYVEDVWSIYKNGIRKEKNAITHLWIIVLLFFPFISFSLPGNIKTREINDVQITSSQINTSLFAAVIENEKDWWEDLKIGTWNDKQMRWFNIETAPREQSILSVRFVDLEGLDKDILEVYGQTHMGNGNLYIYEIIDDMAYLIFETSAVDKYYDSIWREENLRKYGYGTCGETYKEGNLTTDYDVDQDGIVNITLSGIQFIDCEYIYDKEGVTYSEMIRVGEVPIKKHYTLTQ